MSTIEESIQKRLFQLQDLKYKEFQCKLMPTVNPDTVIGVRTPQLRALAKELANVPGTMEFLKLLPHKYYEENNLHSFIICTIKDYNTAVEEVDKFLPYVDNWATCDQMAPKVFKKHLPELFTNIQGWLRSDQTYTIRFGIGMLMGLYLDDAFTPEVLELVSKVKSEEYYVNMMIAWFFATALAKQYDSTLPYIQQRKLDKWTHNKTIQKSIESYRITHEQKEYLRTLKVK